LSLIRHNYFLFFKKKITIIIAIIAKLPLLFFLYANFFVSNDSEEGEMNGQREILNKGKRGTKRKHRSTKNVLSQSTPLPILNFETSDVSLNNGGFERLNKTNNSLSIPRFIRTSETVNSEELRSNSESKSKILGNTETTKKHQSTDFYPDSSSKVPKINPSKSQPNLMTMNNYFKNSKPAKKHEEKKKEKEGEKVEKERASANAFRTEKIEKEALCAENEKGAHLRAEKEEEEEEGEEGGEEEEEEVDVSAFIDSQALFETKNGRESIHYSSVSEQQSPYQLESSNIKIGTKIQRSNSFTSNDAPLNIFILQNSQLIIQNGSTMDDSVTRDGHFVTGNQTYLSDCQSRLTPLYRPMGRDGPYSSPLSLQGSPQGLAESSQEESSELKNTKGPVTTDQNMQDRVDIDNDNFDEYFEISPELLECGMTPSPTASSPNGKEETMDFSCEVRPQAGAPTEINQNSGVGVLLEHVDNEETPKHAGQNTYANESEEEFGKEEFEKEEFEKEEEKGEDEEEEEEEEGDDNPQLATSDIDYVSTLIESPRKKQKVDNDLPCTKPRSSNRTRRDHSSSKKNIRYGGDDDGGYITQFVDVNEIGSSESSTELIDMDANQTSDFQPDQTSRLHHHDVGFAHTSDPSEARTDGQKKESNILPYQSIIDNVDITSQPNHLSPLSLNNPSELTTGIAPPPNSPRNQQNNPNGIIPERYRLFFFLIMFIISIDTAKRLIDWEYRGVSFPRLGHSASGNRAIHNSNSDTERPSNNDGDVIHDPSMQTQNTSKPHNNSNKPPTGPTQDPSREEQHCSMTFDSPSYENKSSSSFFQQNEQQQKEQQQQQRQQEQQKQQHQEQQIYNYLDTRINATTPNSSLVPQEFTPVVGFQDNIGGNNNNNNTNSSNNNNSNSNNNNSSDTNPPLQDGLQLLPLRNSVEQEFLPSDSTEYSVQWGFVGSRLGGYADFGPKIQPENTFQTIHQNIVATGSVTNITRTIATPSFYPPEIQMRETTSVPIVVPKIPAFTENGGLSFGQVSPPSNGMFKILFCKQNIYFLATSEGPRYEETGTLPKHFPRSEPGLNASRIGETATTSVTESGSINFSASCIDKIEQQQQQQQQIPIATEVNSIQRSIQTYPSNQTWQNQESQASMPEKNSVISPSLSSSLGMIATHLSGSLLQQQKQQEPRPNNNGETLTSGMIGYLH
jgi:hypothetical protein